MDYNWRMEHPPLRICKACDKELPIEAFYWTVPGIYRRYKCKTCYSAEQAVKVKARYHAAPEAKRAEVRAHRRRLREAGLPEQRRVKANGLMRPDDYYAAKRVSSNALIADLRDETFAAYGGACCACCGESQIQFLSLDHINGNGNKHRKETGNAGGHRFYRVLKKQGFPPGYQVLCMNCNCGRHRNGGICPHKQAE